MPNRKRPANIADMTATLKRFFSAEGIAHALAFQPLPSDVFVATYPKCGTTWVQQIFHGLRSNG